MNFEHQILNFVFEMLFVTSYFFVATFGLNFFLPILVFVSFLLKLWGGGQIIGKIEKPTNLKAPMKSA